MTVHQSITLCTPRHQAIISQDILLLFWSVCIILNKFI